jgi:CheY-like chemotaxis protein
MGFTVKSAASGQEGIRLYRECQQRRPVVLLDVQMPGMDGPATLAALQKFDPEVKCCFMSGGTGEYTPEELLELGADHLFHKPFTDWGFLEQALSEMAEGIASQQVTGPKLSTEGLPTLSSL